MTVYDELQSSDYISPYDVFTDDEFVLARTPLLHKDKWGRIHQIYGSKKMEDGSTKMIGSVRRFLESS